jgi:hypothetical protein
LRFKQRNESTVNAPGSQLRRNMFLSMGSPAKWAFAIFGEGALTVAVDRGVTMRTGVRERFPSWQAEKIAAHLRHDHSGARRPRPLAESDLLKLIRESDVPEWRSKRNTFVPKGCRRHEREPGNVCGAIARN